MGSPRDYIKRIAREEVQRFPVNRIQQQTSSPDPSSVIANLNIDRTRMIAPNGQEYNVVSKGFTEYTDSAIKLNSDTYYSTNILKTRQYEDGSEDVLIVYHGALNPPAYSTDAFVKKLRSKIRYRIPVSALGPAELRGAEFMSFKFTTGGKHLVCMWVDNVNINPVVDNNVINYSKRTAHFTIFTDFKLTQTSPTEGIVESDNIQTFSVLFDGSTFANTNDLGPEPYCGPQINLPIGCGPVTSTIVGLEADFSGYGGTEAFPIYVYVDSNTVKIDVVITYRTHNTQNTQFGCQKTHHRGFYHLQTGISSVSLGSAQDIQANTRTDQFFSSTAGTFLYRKPGQGLFWMRNHSREKLYTVGGCSPFGGLNNTDAVRTWFGPDATVHEDIPIPVAQYNAGPFFVAITDTRKMMSNEVAYTTTYPALHSSEGYTLQVGPGVGYLIRPINSNLLISAKAIPNVNDADGYTDWRFYKWTPDINGFLQPKAFIKGKGPHFNFPGTNEFWVVKDYIIR